MRKENEMVERKGVVSRDIAFTLVLGIVLSCQVSGAQYVEDFADDVNPTVGGFASQVFQHTILPPESGSPGDAIWNFGTNHGLYLVLQPAIDEITFSLAPGEYVSYASVKLLNEGGVDWINDAE